MMDAGKYHRLKVNRISDFGLYLTDEEGNEVLLPNRYVSIDDKIGDELEVFVYHDSENRLVATTEKPYGAAGEVAYLKIVDRNPHGAFLDWGLTAKDLFLPNSNMVGRPETGRRYIVFIYIDQPTGRATATMKLNEFISNEKLSLKRGQEVNVMVARETETGYRVVIDNRFWGMLYRNQLYSPVRIGDRLAAYVRKITEDNRVDLSLQQEGFDEVRKSAAVLIKLLRENEGRLPLNDDSSPDEVAALTKMSKKVFKRTAGYLMKRGVLKMDADGMELIEQ